MKADLGEYGDNKLQEVVPELLTIMIGTMKEKEILVQKEDDDLWEITYIQIQWIAPSLKDELFPDEDMQIFFGFLSLLIDALNKNLVDAIYIG